MARKLIQKTIFVEGMSCVSCEIRIEKALRKLVGVAKVKVTYSNATVNIAFDAKSIDLETIVKCIKNLNYKIKKDSGNDIHNNSNDKMKINQLLGIGIIIFAIYFIIKNTVGFNFIPEVNQSMGYGILFIVGLLTSLHCIAMCGGLNLSQCVSYKFEGL